MDEWDDDESETTEEPATACALCKREVDELTVHHLIPKSRHKNKKAKDKFGRDEMRNRVAMLCGPCHANIHAIFSEKTLEREFPTLELLAADPDVLKFTEWIKNKPASFHVSTHRANNKR